MFLAWDSTGDIGWMEVIRTWTKSISNRLKESNEIRHSEQSTIPKRSLICATSHISRVKSAIMKRRRRVDVRESSSQMKPDPIQILRPLPQFITMSFIDNSITQYHWQQYHSTPLCSKDNWSQFQSSGPGMGDSGSECRIYVGNLPPDIRSKDIEDLFYK